MTIKIQKNYTSESTWIPKWINEKSIILGKNKLSKIKKPKNDLEPLNCAKKFSSKEKDEPKKNIKNSTVVKNVEINIFTENEECSCGGENEKCFRCGGSGFYIKTAAPVSKNKTMNYSLKTNYKNAKESNFSNDPRGDFYGIRENGRFNSNPLYDDHE